jgi:hypothetical protein
MGKNIKENGKKVIKMEGEFMSFKLVMYMKGIGFVVKDMEKASIDGVMEKFIVGNGKMIK